ncbi:MAG TPA: hypothetical protein VLC49_12700 [Solirubrobacteraceae bacterium]|nr:hypothetical protein [Solirubrobacteraceae bacterium]
MTTTQKPAVGARAARTARARAEADALRIEHVQRSLEAVQKDMASIGGSLGTGARDLRRDAMRMLRSARRDLAKMRRSVQRDLDRLQKDLIATAKPPVSDRPSPAPRRTRSTTTRSAQRQTTASSH